MDVSYVFQGSGGYGYTNPSIANDLLELQVNVFDVTDAIEVAIPADVLNRKIGIYKTFDTNGQRWVLDPSYNPNGISDIYGFSNNNNCLYQDSISLSANEFVNAIGSVENVISVGGLKYAYRDFAQYVRDYFNLGNGRESYGFTSLMDISPEFQINHQNNNLFDKMALWNAFASVSIGDISTNRLTGSIKVSDLTESLRYAVEYNAFGNRGGVGAVDGSGNRNHGIGPLDASYNTYGVYDGFLPDDLIFIPHNGFTIEFHLRMNYRSTLGTNGGSGGGSGIINTDILALNPNVTKLIREVAGTELSFFNTMTLSTKNYIGRTISVPLLIRVV